MVIRVKNKNMKKIMIFMFALLSVAIANAQDKVEGTVGADVVSRYVWRGQVLGDAAIQPTAGLSYKGLSLTGWASISFVDADKYDKEYDITLAYTTGGFNIGITDYFFDKPNADNRYFEYRSCRDENNNRLTRHVWEANVGYDFGPLAIQWYTNFAGNDGANRSGNRAYSSYFELSAPFKLATCDWTAKLGFVPYATDAYNNADGTMHCTVASVRCTKEIPVCKNWGIPVFGEIIGNPSMKKAYLVLGATFALPE